MTEDTDGKTGSYAADYDFLITETPMDGSNKHSDDFSLYLYSVVMLIRIWHHNRRFPAFGQIILYIKLELNNSEFFSIFVYHTIYKLTFFHFVNSKRRQKSPLIIDTMQR